VILIIMGVMGAGKTTVGRLLAEKLGWEFVDADRYHSPASIEKMRAGISLDDRDRAPWLAALHAAVLDWTGKQHNVVLACSALKRAYREQFLTGPEVRFVYLRVPFELVSARLKSRQRHFATEDLLASQFATLEEPEDAITVEASRSPQEIADEILKHLRG